MSKNSKEYMNEYMKNYYRKNPQKYEEQKNRTKKWHRKNRKLCRERERERKANLRFSVLAIYSNGQPKCACCGETTIEFLTIDHVNQQGAKHRRGITKGRPSGVHICQWLKKNGFPEGFQVLCWNCNCGRAKNDGVCPHEVKRKFGLL